MHPSAALITWLGALLATQLAGYAGLGLLLAAGLLIAPGAVRPWLAYLRRVLWLLLSLWLILAYNTPGEAVADLAWAPTYEGIDDANRQALRLVVMLACLAVLFACLGRDGLISALWGLLRPFRHFGLNPDRLVIRLSLVLENLQSPAMKLDWRSMLVFDAVLPGGADVLRFQQSPWLLKDVLYAVLAAGFLVGAMVL